MVAAKKPASNNREFSEVPLIRAPLIQGLETKRTKASPDLGPLKNLLGAWEARGTGWNMIALPFSKSTAPPAAFKFRVLMNQYSEILQFTFVDDGVPNRGLMRPGKNESDQRTATVDYQQVIRQVAAEDRPNSGGLAGSVNDAIHHEPGLWLFDKNLRSTTDIFDGAVATESELDVARLASIPHGNSVLALGRSAVHNGMPAIPPLTGLPSGRFEDVSTPDYDFRDPVKPDPYLEPYRHYIANPFMGNVTVPGFPGFSPADMNQILRFANRGVNILRTTTLTVDTTIRSGGISSTPFSKREADPVSMKSTFWIQELAERDERGNPRLRLQYSQVVMLNFFAPREDGLPERAAWPHVSIATLNKIDDNPDLVAV
ncbi:heme-binding protein [Ensifer adhaerens]|uniref:heme-binding protein n=1 Tax=Ensifer adhaerens TaxID=106592 RepID=UPI000CF1874E|nr:heme-binding protein [Ensifer adhaerens]